MRELKFRIWDVYNKTMRYHPTSWFLLRLNGRVVDGEGCGYDEHHPVSQFINLKDKDHKEIYEGDILLMETAESTPYEFLYVVDYYDGSYNQPYVYRKMKDSEIVEVVGRAAIVNYSKYKVIGNIYENPLKVL